MKILKGILTGLLMVIIIPLMIVFIVYLSSRSVVSKKGVNDLFNKIDLSDFLINDSGQYTSFGKEIKDELVEHGVPADAVDEFVNSEQITDFFSDYAGDIVEFIAYDSDLDDVKADDISKLINDNIDEIFDDLKERKVEGYEELTEERKVQIKDEVDNLAKEIEKNLPDVQKAIDDSDYKIAIDVVRIIFSKLVLITLIAILAVLALLIVLLNLKNFRFTTLLGIVLILSSLPFIVANSLVSTITINADSKAIIDFIKFCISKTAVIATIFLIVGIVLIILGIVLKIVSKGKNKGTKIDTPNYTEEVVPVASDAPVAAEVQPTETPVVQESLEQPIEPPVEQPVVEQPKETPASDETPSPTSVEPISGEAAFCSECGAKLNPGQNFCYNCGTTRK